MLNPILAFSATRRMRSFRTLLVAGAYLLVMLLTAALMLSRLMGDTVSVNAVRAGVACYQVLLILQFVLIVLISPAMASGAIAGERERQTLELLLVTNTRSLRIVTGKVMETFAMLALLVCVGFPVMCLTLLAGAVTFPQILLGEAFLLVMAFASASVGVLASSLARSTVISSVLGYIFLMGIGLVSLLPVLGEVPAEVTEIVYDSSRLAALKSGEALKMIPPLLFLNPGYALASLLQGQTGMFTSLMQYHEMGRLQCSLRLMERAGGETVALISCGAILALALLLLPAAAAMVRRSTKSRRGK